MCVFAKTFATCLPGVIILVPLLGRIPLLGFHFLFGPISSLLPSQSLPARLAALKGGENGPQVGWDASARGYPPRR